MEDPMAELLVYALAAWVLLLAAAGVALSWQHRKGR